MRFRHLLALLIFACCRGEEVQTYAEKLGFAKSDRVLILHMDDAGMSFDSNEGIRQVLENGAARSLSVMMPCPWVPHMVRYIKGHGDADAGLHLTLTSEWREYRWGPLAGVIAVPGLVDNEGAMWSSVSSVVSRATPEEVDREIRAQLDRAERMAFHPTHLDSHMGTLFAKPEFLDKYVRLGIETQIPVMLPSGHNTYLRQTDGSNPLFAQLQRIGEQLWRAGLPVLDDLHNSSYGWKVPTDLDSRDDDQLRRWRTRNYMDTLRQLRPGVTMVIMHCTATTENFTKISDSGPIRRADMLAMLDPAFARFLRDQGFVLTTWRELLERRRSVRPSRFTGR